MNLRIKKIIAREFMILIAVVVLAILAFLFTIVFNQISENRISTEESKIDRAAQEQDSLIKVFNKIFPNDEICIIKRSDQKDAITSLTILKDNKSSEEIINNYKDSIRNVLGVAFTPIYNYYDEDSGQINQQHKKAFVKSRKYELYRGMNDLNLYNKSFKKFDKEYKR